LIWRCHFPTASGTIYTTQYVSYTNDTRDFTDLPTFQNEVAINSDTAALLHIAASSSDTASLSGEAIVSVICTPGANDESGGVMIEKILLTAYRQGSDIEGSLAVAGSVSTPTHLAPSSYTLHRVSNTMLRLAVHRKDYSRVMISFKYFSINTSVEK
jgi:hypothetical protein